MVVNEDHWWALKAAALAGRTTDDEVTLMCMKTQQVRTEKVFQHIRVFCMRQQLPVCYSSLHNLCSMYCST